MKRQLGLVVLFAMAMVAASQPAFAGARVFIGVGVPVVAPIFPPVVYPVFPPPVVYAPPPVIYTPPPVYVQPPPVYVEQPPPPPPAPAGESSFWYYCADAKAYYPYVKECPGGWMKVVPQQPANR